MLCTEVALTSSGDDEAGRFLISADIDGRLIVWDVRNMCPLRLFAPPSSGADGKFEAPRVLPFLTSWQSLLSLR